MQNAPHWISHLWVGFTALAPLAAQSDKPQMTNTAIGLREPRHSRNDELIRAALDDIAAAQRDDGGFDIQLTAGTESDAIKLAEIDAVAAFMRAALADGSTLRSGRYKQPLKQAVKFLRAAMDKESGRIGPVESPLPRVHTSATFALAECASLSGYRSMRRNVRRAFAWLDSSFEVPATDDATFLADWTLTLLSEQAQPLDVYDKGIARAVRSLVRSAKAGPVTGARSLQAAAAIFIARMTGVPVPAWMREELASIMLKLQLDAVSMADGSAAQMFAFGCYSTPGTKPNRSLLALDKRIRTELTKEDALRRFGVGEVARYLTCLIVISRRVPVPR